MGAAARSHQLQVWESFAGAAENQRLRDAFFAVPRHLFVERYRISPTSEWRVVGDDPTEHLPVIYANGGIGIFFEEGDPRVATMSSPHMVLTMLDLLALEPGQRVYEVGTGSGWSAALMGWLVAPGQVVSVEIIPELIPGARCAMQRAGVSNVEVLLGDGSIGPQTCKPLFDRAVFTAGASDIPKALFECVRKGGLLLFILAIPGGGNVLIQFERTEKGFESRVSRRCEFVPVTGAGSAAPVPLAPLELLPEWPRLSSNISDRRSFPLCSERGRALQDRTLDLRSYLWLADPDFRTFQGPSGLAFGIYDESRGSLALAADGALTTYGSPAAGGRLREHIREWASGGCPSIVDFAVTALPADQRGFWARGEWVLRCRDACFVFSRPELL